MKKSVILSLVAFSILAFAVLSVEPRPRPPKHHPGQPDDDDPKKNETIITVFTNCKLLPNNTDTGFWSRRPWFPFWPWTRFWPKDHRRNDTATAQPPTVVFRC